MKVLITGSKGFIGKNLIYKLKEIDPSIIIYEFDKGSSLEELDFYTKDCDFVFNFAAVHRPIHETEFNETNHLLFAHLLTRLEYNKNKCPVLYTSSIQATNGSLYGQSKINAENDLMEFSKKNGNRAIIYRLSNTFGRWATPNHHSVVATFCYNVAHNIQIRIDDETRIMHFYYIDDVINSFVSQIYNIEQYKDEEGFCVLPPEKVYSVTIGKLAELIVYFEDCLQKGDEPKVNSLFEMYLLFTYKSYRTQ